MRPSLLCAALWFFLIASPAIGQSSTPAVRSSTEPPSAVSQTRSPTSYLDIKIETSRPQPTPGTDLSVDAEIRNVSTVPLTITNYGTRLITPPEINGCPYPDYFAFIPTGTVVGNSPFGAKANFDPFTILTLSPGEAARVFWSLGVCGAIGGRITKQVFSELEYIFFVPGDYHVTAQIRFWMNPRDASEALHSVWNLQYREPELYAIPKDYDPSIRVSGIASQSATVRLITPQTVLLAGAALGGLLAFLIRTQQTTTGVRISEASGVWVARYTRYVVSRSSAAIAAMLLSIITTILLNRISESQFLIRVTIADFWGAVTVGFLAAYSGTRLLAQIAGFSTETTTVVRPGEIRSDTSMTTVDVKEPSDTALVRHESTVDHEGTSGKEGARQSLLGS